MKEGDELSQEKQTQRLNDFGLAVSGLKLTLDINNERIEKLAPLLSQSSRLFKLTNKTLRLVLKRLEYARRRQLLTLLVLVAICVVSLLFFTLFVWLIDYVIKNEVLNHIVAAIAL